MRLIVDASIAVKWAVDEDGHGDAVALVLAGHELLVPDFVFVEVGNALWKKVRRSEIDFDQAIAAAREIRIAFSELLPTVELTDRALAIALELNHPIYDCVYIAAAEEHDALLVTADKRLVKAVAATQFAGLAIALGEANG